MSRFLDVNRWPRRAAFEFFRGFDNPYFNVCARLDVSPLVELARSERISFSLASLFLAMRVANGYEPFRFRLSEGRVLVHDRIHAGTTHLADGERLAFVYFDFSDDFEAFRAAAERARREAEAALDGEIVDARPERSDLIHFSSLPWVSFTSISHARNWRREDSVPKLTFGRYERVADRWSLPVSVEVHHALMDGVHVGEFFRRLQACFGEPGPLLGRG